MHERHQQMVLPDGAAQAEHAARQFADVARTAIGAHGRFSVALAGGNTPRRMYELLATPPFSQQIDWSNVHVFWSDERYVPPDDPESCYRMARESLLEHVPIPAGNIYPMPTIGSTPEAAAQAYATTITGFLGALTPRFDLILLGMGPDGHTASLFPGRPEVIQASDALIIPVYQSPKPPPTRLSFTLRLINAAARVMFLVAGADKAAVVREVLQGQPDPAKLPAQGVQPNNGTLTWLLDSAAAQDLQQ